MTAMPQLVSLFNAVGGGAAALIALGDLEQRRRRQPAASIARCSTC
jgi:NAD(P) transhydrogenase subunit beta